MYCIKSKFTPTKFIAGFTILEFVVAMALTGMVFQGVMSIISSSAKEMKAVGNQVQMENLRTFVRKTVSCEKTMSAWALTAAPGDLCNLESAPFQLRGESDQPILSFRQNMMGASLVEYKIRGICTNPVPSLPTDTSPAELNIEYQINVLSPKSYVGPWSYTGMEVEKRDAILRMPITCEPEGSKPATGTWVQAPPGGAKCSNVCATIMKSNTLSIEEVGNVGSYCTSGEITAPSSCGIINNIYGTWGGSPGGPGKPCMDNGNWFRNAKNDTIPGLERFCYGTGADNKPQVKDYDVTDITTGCYCTLKAQ